MHFFNKRSFELAIPQLIVIMKSSERTKPRKMNLFINSRSLPTRKLQVTQEIRCTDRLNTFQVITRYEMSVLESKIAQGSEINRRKETIENFEHGKFIKGLPHMNFIYDVHTPLCERINAN